MVRLVGGVGPAGVFEGIDHFARRDELGGRLRRAGVAVDLLDLGLLLRVGLLPVLVFGRHSFVPPPGKVRALHGAR